MEQAKTEKKTIRTGRRIGLKDRARVSIAINDPYREISRLWELVKKCNSRKKETAAETARRVFLRGLTAELEEIMLANAKAAEAEQERLQGRLFDA